MSAFPSRVGPWNFKWKSIPRGRQGSVEVEVPPGQVVQVEWRRDQDGIWLVLPNGVFGFDLQAEYDENGRNLYRLNQRGSMGEWAGVLATGGADVSAGVLQNSKRKANRIRAQMPGKIVRILVAPGQTVEKGQPVLVMEAMKMENEIRAADLGKVSQVKVVEGQAVESGAELILFETAPA